MAVRLHWGHARLYGCKIVGALAHTLSEACLLAGAPQSHTRKADQRWWPPPFHRLQLESGAQTGRRSAATDSLAV